MINKYFILFISGGRMKWSTRRTVGKVKAVKKKDDDPETRDFLMIYQYCLQLITDSVIASASVSAYTTSTIHSSYMNYTNEHPYADLSWNNTSGNGNNNSNISSSSSYNSRDNGNNNSNASNSNSGGSLNRNRNIAFNSNNNSSSNSSSGYKNHINSNNDSSDNNSPHNPTRNYELENLSKTVKQLWFTYLDVWSKCEYNILDVFANVKTTTNNICQSFTDAVECQQNDHPLFPSKPLLLG